MAYFLFAPVAIMAQRNPMVEVAESSSKKRRVPGANQYGKSAQDPPL